MPSIALRRDAQSGSAPTSTMNHLLVALVVLVVFGLVLGGSLFFIRRYRRARKEAGTLPSYEDSTNPRNHNRLTIQTNRQSMLVYSEKQNLIDNSSPMPLTPESVPEIRITFPEEVDQEGRRVSGRVMVVQVGEAGVGFVKPIDQEGLPPYQQQQSEERFASVDLDRIGGLKEVR